MTALKSTALGRLTSDSEPSTGHHKCTRCPEAFSSFCFFSIFQNIAHWPLCDSSMAPGWRCCAFREAPFLRSLISLSKLTSDHFSPQACNFLCFGPSSRSRRCVAKMFGRSAANDPVTSRCLQSPFLSQRGSLEFPEFIPPAPAERPAVASAAFRYERGRWPGRRDRCKGKTVRKRTPSPARSSSGRRSSAVAGGRLSRARGETHDASPRRRRLHMEKREQRQFVCSCFAWRRTAGAAVREVIEHGGLLLVK